MKWFASTFLLMGCLFSDGEPSGRIPNPAINYGDFQKLVSDLAATNESHRITEERFIEMASNPRTIVLDARTKSRYDHIHIKGAVHLALTEFTAEALRKVIPGEGTRILIYCNNNFENEPVHFARKDAAVSLNVQTFSNLHAYGYRNVYELGPLLDVETTRIRFEGALVNEAGRPKKGGAVVPEDSSGPLRILPKR